MKNLLIIILCFGHLIAMEKGVIKDSFHESCEETCICCVCYMACCVACSAGIPIIVRRSRAKEDIIRWIADGGFAAATAIAIDLADGSLQKQYDHSYLRGKFTKLKKRLRNFKQVSSGA